MLPAKVVDRLRQRRATSSAYAEPELRDRVPRAGHQPVRRRDRSTSTASAATARRSTRPRRRSAADRGAAQEGAGAAGAAARVLSGAATRATVTDEGAHSGGGSRPGAAAAAGGGLRRGVAHRVLTLLLRRRAPAAGEPPPLRAARRTPERRGAVRVQRDVRARSLRGQALRHLSRRRGHERAWSPGNGQLCGRCHELDLTRRYVHGPLASGGCTVCHDPHSSRYRYLLVSDSDGFCLSCHDARRVAGRSRPRAARPCAAPTATTPTCPTRSTC